MKPADERCEEHGMYLYRTGFGWSCKLGCYYTDDPQKIKDGFIAQYKEELKDKIHKNSKCLNIDTEYYNGYREAVNNILKLLESEDK